MRTSSLILRTSTLIGMLLGASTVFACGVERWPVKVGNDPDAAQVDLLKASSTTIASLDAIAAPADRPADARVTDVEKTVYVIDAFLTAYKHESDQDYHLALSDDAGHTLIVEIPDPACADTDSPFLAGIKKARQQFDAQLKAGSSFKTVHIAVHVTGVGFFDFDHGQRGVAPNAIELHPVLDIQFTPAAAQPATGDAKSKVGNKGRSEKGRTH